MLLIVSDVLLEGCSNLEPLSTIVLVLANMKL